VPLEPLLAVEFADVGVVAVPVTPEGGFAFGGTSCTCRFRGWFDFDGGGLTKINVYIQRKISLIPFERQRSS